MAVSTALVQAGSREMGPVEQGLTPYSGGGAALGEPVQRRLGRLRQDREAHSRKQIWTKDPHGGPYRKASTAAPPPCRLLPPPVAAAIAALIDRADSQPTLLPCRHPLQVNINQGYDPLIQLPDGKDRPVGWSLGPVSAVPISKPSRSPAAVHLCACMLAAGLTLLSPLLPAPPHVLPLCAG